MILRKAVAGVAWTCVCVAMISSQAAAATTAAPFGGSAVVLPGTIEAENFDDGGASVAYFDTTAGNRGGAYRQTDVDIETTSDIGGGWDIGWTRAGEWLTYTTNVTAAGTYTIDVRLACSGVGGSFHVEVNGVDKTGPIAVPNTGGWQVWTTVSKAGVSLAAGPQIIRVVLDTGNASGSVANLNWLKVR